MSRPRVVVTGVGAVTPLGLGASTLFERWAAGESGVNDDGYARADEFDPTDNLTSKEIRRTDRFTQLAIAASDEAIEDAGWKDELPYDAEDVACVIGTGIGGLGTLETQHDVLRDQGPKRVSALSVPLMMPNAAPAAVTMRHGIHGPTVGTVSACSGGADALGAAMRMLRTGEVKAVLAGGSESAMTPLSLAAFTAMGATSPSGISRPFDARRDGFVMAEGAGVLVLEDGDAAEARGARILGELVGYGASADAHHITAPEPSGKAAVRAMLKALENAGLSPEDVDYINAHGTSTPLNDRAETGAIKQAFGERAKQIPISSTKSAIGHTLGAAGAVEAIATLKALADRTAPPTLNYGEPEEGLDLDWVPNEARPLVQRQNGAGPKPLVALSNSFGFGGHNAVVCLRVP